jgi:hypothetical protein
MSRIDAATGTRVVYKTATSNAGTTGGLAFNSITGVLYVSSSSNDSLFALDPNTGVATLVGAYGDSTIVMQGLEFDSSTGTLYGASGSSSNTNFYSIDVNTGAATLIGDTGAAVISPTSPFVNLCYHPVHDVMYATVSGSADSFYSLNRATGALTPIGPLSGPQNPNGMAFNPLDGQVYLIDNSTDTLYTIDTTTGAATSVGAVGTSNLLGLAWLPFTGSYQQFGSGCAGMLGVPGNVPVTAANVGQTLSVDLTNLPFDAAVFMLGFSNTTSTLGPLPVDLGVLGAPGCFGRVSPDITGFILGAGGVANYSVAIPDVPNLFVGVPLYTQGLVFDTVNALGFTTSDASTAVIGF